eukprot:TRINITY_DN567_c2_g1_i1.p1 TRINITY_DN567_c2_g1~~TRINITY_DN567_c2_g1_i1.p1  ORF type:complete len:487 (-),score=53.01 TRINITY_DN567_c2_g1_i1:340-1800(-)
MQYTGHKPLIPQLVVKRKRGGLCRDLLVRQRYRLFRQQQKVFGWTQTDTQSAKASRRNKCYGCGTKLQTQDENALGYVDPVKYKQKQMHRQLDQLLCSRCVQLTHGAMIPGVEDFKKSDNEGIQFDGDTLPTKRLMRPEELREQLQSLKKRKVIVVYLVDILDVSGSFFKNLRELIGSNPVLLFGTKSDLLPRSTNFEHLHQWLLSMAVFKKLNVVAVHLISSKTGQGFESAARALLKERQGRDVIVMGAANVGKSAFCRAIIKQMGNLQSNLFDPAAAQSSRHLPVESAMPGTTLGMIPLQAFASGGILYDTPGVHLSHRLIHYLLPEDLKELQLRKKVVQYVAPSPIEAEEKAVTYLWGAVVRVDVEKCTEDVQFVFQGPNVMKVFTVPLMSQDETIQAEDVEDKSTFFGISSVGSLGGLRIQKEIEIESEGTSDKLIDIAISGLAGWITVWEGRKKGKIKLKVWAPKGVQIYSRPPFPVALPR